MGFDKRSAFALFFPEPLDDVDKGNLLACGVKRVQLFVGVASNLPLQSDWLTSQGVRVTLRIEEPEPSRGELPGSYYSPEGRAAIMERIRAIRRRVPVEAVIIGNEPEIAYNLEWGSANWGNNPDQWFLKPGGKAQAHMRAVDEMAARLRTEGIQPVSPGWSHQRITPRDQPQPGRAAWRELCLPSYNTMPNGAHVYAHDWAPTPHEDENRYLWALGIEVERCHQAVWLNETNVNKRSMTGVDRMRKVRLMAELIAQQAWGGRIVSFCPFVSNGRAGEEWSHKIIRERQAYDELGAWLGG
jgi:hypothetical protein